MGILGRLFQGTREIRHRFWEVGGATVNSCNIAVTRNKREQNIPDDDEAEPITLGQQSLFAEVAP